MFRVIRTQVVIMFNSGQLGGDTRRRSLAFASPRVPVPGSRDPWLGGRVGAYGAEHMGLVGRGFTVGPGGARASKCRLCLLEFEVHSRELHGP